VIHNVAVGYREPRRVETSDGLPQVFATNVLAPYILTALIGVPPFPTIHAVTASGFMNPSRILVVRAAVP
jgi:hypothetical protein